MQILNKIEMVVTAVTIHQEAMEIITKTTVQVTMVMMANLILIFMKIKEMKVMIINNLIIE